MNNTKAPVVSGGFCPLLFLPYTFERGTIGLLVHKPASFRVPFRPGFGFRIVNLASTYYLPMPLTVTGRWIFRHFITSLLAGCGGGDPPSWLSLGIYPDGKCLFTVLTCVTPNTLDGDVRDVNQTLPWSLHNFHVGHLSFLTGDS